jgi:hypothetical protein
VPIDFEGLDLSTTGTASAPSATHFVELYDDHSSLAGSVRTFVSTGFGADEAAIVIATAEHLEAFEAELGRAADLDAARAQGLYHSAGAEETLARFMAGDRPDPERFETVIGALLDRASAGGRAVRVFGEMVAVLWAQGNVGAALELEALWNELARSRPFRLFCAYSTGAFEGAARPHLATVVAQHSHVVVPDPVGR